MLTVVFPCMTSMALLDGNEKQTKFPSSRSLILNQESNSLSKNACQLTFSLSRVYPKET